MRRRKGRYRKKDRQAEKPGRLWIHGLAAIGDERWEEAIATFQKFLKTDIAAHNRALAYDNLSACYLEVGKFDQALAALDESETYASVNSSSLHNRGVIYACMGEIEKAIATLEKLQNDWPRQARQLGAHTTLKELRSIAQGDLPPGDYWVDHLQAQISDDVEFGDYQRVECKARRMIAYNPARPEGHFALALACLELGCYDEAREALLASHEREPDYIPTYLNLALVSIRMEEAAQAIPWLERVLEIDANNLTALYQMGLAHEQLGQREEAVAWWRRARKVSPEDYAVQERLHEMGEGPVPVEPPLPPETQKLKRLIPAVRGRMQRPRVYRNGGLTLTYDKSGFILEDEENPRNATLYAGGPFGIRKIPRQEHSDLLDIIGLFKMMLRMVNPTNTRSVAVLVYYQDGSVYNYQARFARGKKTGSGAHGQFVVTEVPRLFKINIDSDLETPYGNAMQGFLIYINQDRKPGLLISTLPGGW